jgi:hypothetical protein
VSESVAKARVESLSHMEYSQAGGTMGQEDKGRAVELGRMTKLDELESMKTLCLWEASRDPTHRR